MYFDFFVITTILGCGDAIVTPIVFIVFFAFTKVLFAFLSVS